MNVLTVRVHDTTGRQRVQLAAEDTLATLYQHLRSKRQLVCIRLFTASRQLLEDTDTLCTAVLQNGQVIHMEVEADSLTDIVTCTDNAASACTQDVQPIPAAEIVSCTHTRNARCSQCVGRELVLTQREHAAWLRFSSLYSFAVPPKHTAKSQQQALTYGEVRFFPFLQLLRHCSPNHGDVFLDLGSGTGKALLAAAMSFPFARCVGIELVESHHDIAMTVLEKYRTIAPKDEPVIHLICGSFLDSSTDSQWRDADIVYAASTCFDADLVTQLVHRAALLLKPGARFIVLTHALPEQDRSLFQQQHQAPYRMSFGNATAAIYVKL